MPKKKKNADTNGAGDAVLNGGAGVHHDEAVVVEAEAEAAATVEAVPKKPTRKRTAAAAPKENESADAERRPKRPRTRRVAPPAREEPTPEEEVAKPEVPSAIDFLQGKFRQLNESAIDELAGAIIVDTEKVGKVLFISSLNIQALLSRYYYKTASIGDHAEALRVLHLSDADIASADAIVAVVHGPHTEQAREGALYDDDDGDDGQQAALQNMHWSLMCWFKGGHRIYHYDSLFPLNQDRCEEVVAVLAKFGIFPDGQRMFAVPDFMPKQKKVWECGYYVLLFLKIVCDKAAASPAQGDDVHESYRWFIMNMHQGPDGPFQQHLMALLDRGLYD
jgi:hypothetical protein